MKNQDSADVPFSPDFAARILAQADTIVRRRRRDWRAAGITIGAAGLAIAALWSIPSSRDAAPRPTVPAVQVADTDEFAFRSPAGSDPLQWMFPDAQPVVQFADRYSTASTGGAEQRQRLLFAGETDGIREP